MSEVDREVDAPMPPSVIQFQVLELSRDVRELTKRVESIPVLGQRVGATEDATRRLETAIDKMGDKFEKAIRDNAAQFNNVIKDFRTSVLTWTTIFALLLGGLIAVLQLVIPHH